MIRIILLAVFFIIPLFGQTEEQNPNVELPDFVITGTDILSVQKGKKADPELISTFSEETLKPVFSVEELEMRELSNPIKDDISLFDTLNYYSGKLMAGAGFYTLPVAELRYAVPFNSGIFESYAGGKNIRSYVNNSSRYNAEAGLNLNLYTSSNSSFLPGSMFGFHGDIGTSAFKFYGGPDPMLKREIYTGNFAFQFHSLSGRFITGGVEIKDDYNQIKTENFNEHFFSSGGFLKLNITPVTVTVNASLERQMLTLENGDYSYSLFTLRPSVGFNFTRAFKTSLGLTYSRGGDEDFIAPYAAAAVRLNKSFSFFGEYSPAAKLYNQGHFLSLNRFYNVGFFEKLYSEEMKLQGAVKFEYDKYFQIDAGMKYLSSDNFPYLAGNNEGKFDIFTTKGEVITAFADFLFHRGPFGNFYGTVELISATNSDDYRIPYYPEINASLSYGYEIGIFGLHTKLYYNSEVFTGIENREELPGYIDLNFGADLKLNQRFSLFFEINNILNRNNYIWRGYKEPPLDLLGGFIYRW